MGHTQCGAVNATIKELKRPGGEQSKNIKSIVDRIRPSVESFAQSALWHNHDELIDQAIRANVRASVNQLRHGSTILENLIQTEDLLIVGAEYSVETGVVDFFEGLP